MRSQLTRGEPELHRLVGRASVQIVFERDGCLRCHPSLHDRDGLSALYKIKPPAAITERHPAAHLAAAIPDRPVRRGIDVQVRTLANRGVRWSAVLETVLVSR